MKRRNFLTQLTAVLGLGIVSEKANSISHKNDTLSPEDIAKAWENPEFRESLTEAQWESLPQNPAGDLNSGEFSGNLQMASGNSCSGNNCSGNNCSGDNCSGNNCSGDNCSGNNCSGNNCSGNNCSGNNCSGYNCGQYN